MVAVLAALCGFAALAISMSGSGGAAFPGGNGRIAYAYGDAYQGSIWSANANGSSPAKLTSGSNDYNPTYSANGARIAFEREGGVAVMNGDGSGLTQLLFGSGSWSFEPPKWEENYENPEKPSEVIPFVKIQTYTETWHSFNGPAFSPDGAQIAVRESAGKYFGTSICAVEEDEDQDCISGYEPGSFFHYEEECIECAAHIIMVNSATGARTGEVTPASEANRDFEPAYSSTGKLAFSRRTEGGSSIFVVNTPGASPVQVTTGPEDYGPDFSPDGSRIAFSHGSREVGMVGAGGGALTVLPVPNPPGASYSYLESPVFSPDGSKIAFERTVYPTGGKSEHGIYTMATDGTGLTKILEGFSPSWQPVPPPPPPPIVPAKAQARKGKVKLDKKGKATVGTIVCGSSPCSLKVLSAKLKAGKKTCPVKTTLARKLAPGKSTKLGVKLGGKCLTAVKKAGKGSLAAKVQLSDALGKKALTFKSTLIPAKEKKDKKAKR